MRQTEAEPFQQPHEHDPAHFGAPHQGYGETDAEFDESWPRKRRSRAAAAAA